MEMYFKVGKKWKFTLRKLAKMKIYSKTTTKIFSNKVLSSKQITCIAQLIFNAHY